MVYVSVSLPFFVSFLAQKREKRKKKESSRKQSFESLTRTGLVSESQSSTQPKQNAKIEPGFIVMDSKTSSSSVHGPQEPSNHDEVLMQKSLLFSDTLKDLKSLRKQLYSAADYFELAYKKEEQKQMVVETLKDYAIKALINTVDHLGSVAYKVDRFLDQKIDEVSEMELRFFCSEQRLEACQKYISQGGLSQQSLVIKTPKHYKRYIFPADEENMDSFSHAKSNYDSRNFSTEHNLLEFKNAAEASIQGIPSSFFRERHSQLRSPQFYSRQGTFTLSRTSTNNNPEKRSSSPQRFPIIGSGSLLKRSTSPNYADARRRYPSEPRRSVSLTMYSERDKAKDSDQQYAAKSKRLFKALLSMRKSRTLYTCLDQI